MELQIISAMAVAKFESPSFVKDVKPLFNGRTFMFQAKSLGHKTSLMSYSGSYNKKASALPNTKNLTRFICECAKEISDSFGYKTEDYEPMVKNMWINEMSSNSEAEMHSHYGSDFSGCFYVDVPEGSGFIVFETFQTRYDKAELSIKNYTAFNSGNWRIEVKTGDLLIWESFMKHKVMPMQYEGKRLSIAFDVAMVLKEDVVRGIKK
jgi:uncharacterized protein (TIGR02466 family)